MSTKEEAIRSAVKTLAELTEVNTDDEIVCGPSNETKVKMYDDSLKATMVPTLRGTVRIDSPRSPGINVELVDHNRDDLAPEGAIYHITVYNGEDMTQLNGDVYSVYVGRNGIILCDAARKRASKLYQKDLASKSV